MAKSTIKSTEIPFSDKNYLVYSDGKVWSEYSNRFLDGKTISGDNPRLCIDLKVDLVKKGVLLHRLVFFLFYYGPKVLNKKSLTFKDFQKMPLVYHVNGNILDNNISNLKMIISRSDLGKLIHRNFPEKTSIRKFNSSSIKGISILKCIKLLNENKTYTYISKVLGVSDMAVYRFAKNHNLMGNRNNGIPKLKPSHVRLIRKSKKSGVFFAKKFNVTPTLISRVRKNKTYTDVL